mgnify:CR=1 FL=1
MLFSSSNYLITSADPYDLSLSLMFRGVLPSILLQFEPALIGFVLSLFTFVVQIALVIWTYSDATDNSSHSAILWTLVVLFAPLIGVVLYLLLGRDQR